MHPNETALHDYADGTLDASERAEIEQHLGACADCRRVVEDLREIHRAVGELKTDLREPPVRAWARLERAIKLERDHGARRLQPSGSAAEGDVRLKPARSTLLRTASWLAAAAVLLLATAVGLQFRSTRRAMGPAADGSGATTASVSNSEAAENVEAELRAAEEHYTKAITGLEQITKTEQGALDPGTAATLQKNLAVIDQAISESRAALKTQPASEPAQESLVENFKAKIGLLQDTVALINEMRKGNEAGAARIVSGLKPKGD
jgi:anti-sigma-K factor RskA